MTLASTPPLTESARQGLPPEDLAALTRADFPLLDQTACLGQPLIYLDHAATSQKPRQVLQALQHYYSHDNANVHRGAHQLSTRATEGFEGAREKVARLVGARRSHEIGIRMTLGALRSDVLRMVFQQGAILVAAGLALGSLAGLATERAIVIAYPIFQHLSGSAYVLVVVFQFAIAASAILIPSWRATRVDPVRALRCD